jgi:aminoglycoside phosphotransferase (APT) family kinase protein
VTADGRGGIDAALVKRLIAAQFPQWTDLPVRLVPQEGWDNRTYRLGEDMTVRLPSAAGYAAAVEKEQRWLPVLAPQLPLPIPAPIGQGQPALGYPYHWSINRWLTGEPAAYERISDLTEFATTLADFLITLRSIDSRGGPLAGAHSFYRGAPPAHYNAETRAAVDRLGDRIDGARALKVWDEALAASYDGPPVWFHGDIAYGNLLVENGRLSAVIDFGTSGVGDPACDLAITWTFLHGESRETFRRAIAVDDGTWARGRGWTIWKSLIVLADQIDSDPVGAAENQRIIADIIGEL